MFCNQCGNKLREGAKFCNICGEPVAKVSDKPIAQNEPETSTSETDPVDLSSSGVTSQKAIQKNRQHHVFQPQPQPAVQYRQEAYQPQRSYYAPGTHPYHRLGGFLMFMVVGSYISAVNTFISVISTIVTYSGLLSMGKWLPGGFKSWIMFAMIGYIVLSIIAGSVTISYANKIRRKESDFLGFIQTASIIIMIVVSIFYIIAFIWLKQFDNYGVMSTGSIVGIWIAMAIAWLVGLIFGSVYFGSSVRVRTYMGSDAYLKQSVFNKNSHPIPADGSDQPGVIDSRRAVTFNPDKQWYCTQCGRINENYTTACVCGMAKPSGDLSRSWICKNCGRYNMGNLYECVNCGRKKYQDPVYTDWICPKCGGRNSYSANSCSVCYMRNPNKNDGVGKTS